MYIHYPGNSLGLRWTIYRGLSRITEDFESATLTCFLYSKDNKFPVEATVMSAADGGSYLYIELSPDLQLPDGIYGVSAIWKKNEDRSIARSMREGLFSVVNNQAEATDQGGAANIPVLKFHSSAGTFGYDGLSAYEMALLKDLTTKSETEWVQEQLDVATDQIFDAKDVAVGQAETAITAAKDVAVGQAEAAVEAAKDAAVSAADAAIGESKENALDAIAEAIEGLEVHYDIETDKGTVKDVQLKDGQGNKLMPRTETKAPELLLASFWQDYVKTALVIGELNTRVALSLIPANCAIELNDGYEFRKVRQVDENLNTLSIVNTVSNALYCFDTGYLAITICKTNPSEEILSVDGIIKSIKINCFNYKTNINEITPAKYRYYINENNLYYSDNNTRYTIDFYAIKVNPNDIYTIRTSILADITIAFLKTLNNEYDGGVPDFSANYQSRLTKNSFISLKIPEDANYLFLCYKNNVPSPSVLKLSEVPKELPDSYESFTEKQINNSRNNLKLSADDIYDEVKKLNNGEHLSIDISLFKTKNKFISGTNEWRQSEVNHNNSILVPIKAGYVYTIKAGAVAGSIIAFLKSDSQYGEPVNFSEADGFTGRIVLGTNSEVSYTAPNDSNFLYIFKQTMTENFLPSSLTFSVPIINPIKKVVFMGDSITHGVYSFWKDGIHDNEHRYNGFDLNNNFQGLTNEQIVADATAYHGIPYYFGKIANCDVVNLARRGSGFIQDGRNGGTFLDLIEGNPSKTLNGISPYDFTNVDMVLVFLGINDYINAKTIGDVESFATDGTYTRGTVIGNLVIGIKEILSQNPLCKIIIFTPYNTFGQVSKGGDYVSNVPYGTEATNYALGYNLGGGTLQDYIDAIEAVCNFYGIQHVPLSKSNVCNRITLKDIMIDGLHPSKDSYIKLAAEIYGKCNFGD